MKEINQKLITEYLDIAVNDSENTQRFLAILHENCQWSLMPPGIAIKGLENLRKFVGFAMGSRKHNDHSKVIIQNCFSDDDNFCVEYFHGALVMGIKVQETVCLVCQIKDGKFISVNEYVDTGGSLLIRLGLKVFPLVARFKGIKYQKTLAKK